MNETRKKYIVYIIFSIGLILGSFIWLFGTRPFVVSGLSMYPTFNSVNENSFFTPFSGDYIFIDIFTYKFIKQPQRLDVIVAKSPVENRFLLKRIIALPGETIELNQSNVYITDTNGVRSKLTELYLNKEKPIVYKNQKVILKDDEYFILGDNRQNSYDSQSYGPIKENNIVARVLIRIHPFSQFEWFPGKIDIQ